MPSIYYLISLPIFLSSDSLSFHMPFFPLTYSALSVSSDPSFFLSTLLLFFPLPNRFIPFPFAPIFLHPLLFLLLFLYLLPATLFRTLSLAPFSFPLYSPPLFHASLPFSSIYSFVPHFPCPPYKSPQFSPLAVPLIRSSLLVHFLPLSLILMLSFPISSSYLILTLLFPTLSHAPPPSPSPPVSHILMLYPFPTSSPNPLSSPPHPHPTIS